MPPRFTTSTQTTYIAGLSSEITAYHQKFVDVVKFIAGYIEALCPNSGIEIRLITGEGRGAEGMEKWRGHMIALSPTEKVDLWTLTITMSEISKLGQDEAIGSFDKPWGIGIDYAYDWEFGTDASNTEDVFQSRVDAVEYVLERIRTTSSATCLPHGCCIESGLFRRMITRFSNASTHIAKGDFALKFSEL